MCNISAHAPNRPGCDEERGEQQQAVGGYGCHGQRAGGVVMTASGCEEVSGDEGALSE